ncbi:VapC family toxin protein [Buttiauxella gaviniae ATCC 51604]|uniref:VapC family toxin protein n=1 Tax=Buttiauxella gaviniae ATCC 51604 TaxID=1354253 RepID=A0A1B7I3B7_9ENTR|nr:type II toxin-antitoxin system VapC family toxin [Buttiauxella gaviniae]OAT22766.1 VapC family toxin protein [Buttiauxella gaviniae ATCC 51604]
MLDTNICSFIMRKQPEAVLKRLELTLLPNHRIVASAITYAEMRFGVIGKKSSPRRGKLVDAFYARLDAILTWDKAEVDATTEVKTSLTAPVTLIDPNDTANAAGAVLVKNNVRAFAWVPKWGAGWNGTEGMRFY